MNNKKKWLVRIVAFGAALVLLFSFIYGTVAYAQGNMGISGSIKPSKLKEPGSVTLSIKLSNDDEYSMDAIMISGNGVSEEVGSLEPGQSTTVRMEYDVNEYEMNDGIVMTASWIEEGVEQSSGVTIPVEIETSKPEITLKRSINKKNAVPGDEVVITYRIQNTGDIELTDISLTDEKIASGTIVSGLSLAPGKRSDEIEKKIIVTASMEDIVSHPKVTAKSTDGQSVTDSSSEQIIPITAPRLSLQVTEISPQEALAEDGVSNENITPNSKAVKVSLSNTGNVAIENINLKEDDSGVILGDGITLEPEEKADFVSMFEVEEARSYSVSLSGTPKGGGEAINLKSDVLEFAPAFTAEDIVVNVSMELSQAVLDEPGNMHAIVRIDNESPIALQNIVISEKNKDQQLETMAALPEGLTTREYDIPVNESGEIALLVKAYDESGEEYSFESNPVLVTVYVPPSATATPPPEEQLAQGMGSFMWLIILILCIVLFIAILIALIVVGIKSRGKQRELDDMEDFEEARQAPPRRQMPPQNPPPSQRDLQMRANREKTALPPQSNANASRKNKGLDDLDLPDVVQKNPRERNRQPARGNGAQNPAKNQIPPKKKIEIKNDHERVLGEGNKNNTAQRKTDAGKRPSEQNAKRPAQKPQITKVSPQTKAPPATRPAPTAKSSATSNASAYRQASQDRAKRFEDLQMNKPAQKQDFSRLDYEEEVLQRGPEKKPNDAVKQRAKRIVEQNPRAGKAEPEQSAPVIGRKSQNQDYKEHYEALFEEAFLGAEAPKKELSEAEMEELLFTEAFLDDEED